MEEVCRQKAKQLLEDLNISNLPIDVEDISRKCGLELEYVNKGKGFFGQLIKERRIIQVQEGLHPHRQRFTIAHEIGHFILDHNTVVCSVDDRSLKDPRKLNEKQANIFASELLMPERWLKTYWPQMKSDYQAMAKKFQVSGEAMFRRLQDANLLGLDSPL